MYDFPTKTPLEIKDTVSRTNPSLFLASSLAAGLACMELIKTVQKQNTEAMHNYFFNLAFPNFIIRSEPPKPTVNELVTI